MSGDDSGALLWINGRILWFEMQEPQIKKAIDWLINAQQENGLWNVHLVRGKDKDLNLWIALEICRVLKRFCLN
ncbi:MAG: hypothetical protein ABSA79_12935 [Candidatus Bathyarchaeia archaeon]